MPRIPLPPITDFEAYNKNTQEQYEALGRFVVAFELMVNETRECSVNLLDREALAEVAFHHPSLTAKPLFEIFRALVLECLELDNGPITISEKDAFRGVLANIASELDHLINVRNILIHGTWHIGYTSDDDPNSAYFHLSKYKPTKAGLSRESVPKHAFELLALKDRCEDARNWISAVHFCVPRDDRPFDKIKDQFVFQNTAWTYCLNGDALSGETLPRKRQ